MTALRSDREPGPLTEVTPLTQELRLAASMTGGVSLAIWMGGVARELNLLTQASRWRRGGRRPDGTGPAPTAQLQFYFDLINLLDVLVDVDVQSGTSAGGINAVLLAYCRANDKDMGKLRETWLNLGAMEDLLRTPTDQTLPSLMYGDRKLLSGLTAALHDLKQCDAVLPEPLGVTDGATEHVGDRGPGSTLFVTTTLLDGETSHFVDSFGTLVQDVDRHGVFTFRQDDLMDADVIPALALAGRSTASFPGAFEPSFLPAVAASPRVGDVAARQPMATYMGITRSHWAADGGLLDNHPLDLVLERVFDTRAWRPVRRVLLYVVPSSAPAPKAAAESAAAQPGDQLGLVDGLLKDLSAAMSQSIASDLRAVRDHNDQADARADARLQLAEVAGRLGARKRLATTSVLSTYVDRVVAAAGKPLIDDFMRRACVNPPESWSKELAKPDRGENEVVTAIQTALRSAWDFTSLPSDSVGYARYSQPAFDGAKAIALAAVSAAYGAARNDTQRTKVLNALRHVHDAGSRATRTSSPEVRTDLATAATPTGGSDTLGAAASRVAETYLDHARVDAAAWEELGDALLGALSQASPKDSELQVYRTYLTAAGATSTGVARQLFDLMVSERAMRPAAISPDQPVELIQVSADTRTTLAPAHSAYEKLTGMQLHHFGAFYKRSWRANDWMWGRIDGAGWLVHVLLDPRRLALLAAKKRVGERRAFLLAELTAIVGAAPEDGEKPGQAGDINNELGYLDKPDTDLPNALPSTALWVASALQRLIAQEELPQLADEILGAGKPADWSPPASRRWAKRVKAAALADVPATLASCEVQKETLAGDLGSPLMARTMSKAVATAIGAVVSVKRLPAGVRSLLGSVRTMTVGGYRVVRAAHGVAQRTILAGLAMLAVGIVLAAQSTAVLGVTGMSLAAVGGYLVVFATWQLSGRLFGAIVGFTITAAIASLTIRSERRWLFGTTPTKAGWVGRHVHWLGGAWWRPLLPVLAIAIVFALESVVLSALRRWSLGRLHLGSRHASPPDSQG